MTKWFVNVNQYAIRRNLKRADGDQLEAPISIRKGRAGRATYAHRVGLPDGSVVLYSAEDRPLLRCGARVVIECPSEPVVLD